MKESTVSSIEDGEESNSLDLHAVFQTLRERWWLILLCFIFTVGIGVFYIIITPKTYQSTTVIQVEQAPTQVMNNIQDVTTEDLKEQEVLKTIETNLTGAELLINVIDKLGLTPAQLGLKPRNPPYTKEELAATLGEQVTSKLTRGTRLIEVSALNTDPKLAQKISSAVVAEYIRADMAQRIGVSGEANRFLLEQSDTLKQRVAIAEKAAQDFKDAHPNVPLDDSVQFSEDKLRFLTEKVNDARQTRIHLESDNEQVQKILARTQGREQTDQLLTVQSVAADPAVLQIQKSIADEEATFAALKQRYLPKHPGYIQEESKVAGLQSSLGTAVLNAAKGLVTAVDSARQAEEKIEKVLADQRQAKLENDRLTIPYSALTREVDRNRDLYDSVQERLKETDLTVNMDDNKIQTVSAASMPYEPAKPKPILVIPACFVGGILLSFCACYALSMTDRSLRTVDEAEERLGLQAVGAIPIGGKLGSVDDGLGIIKEPDGSMAESFRTLRAALGLLDKDGNHRIFLFTSGVPGEGKSFCSVNYAVSLAQLGRRVLLIDADLRLPSIEPVFFKTKQTNGLSVLLEGGARAEDCYHPTPVPNLFVMPAGRRAQNPSELIANSDFSRVLQSLSTDFDSIVVDTSPVHAVSDTLLIARYADVVCLVVRAGKTPAKVAERAAQKLKDAEAKLAGFILNRLPAGSSNYYYYYGGGSYGKGVYGAKATSNT
jgi:capsular exopolysaccharide synthesis family protein